jgi:hypothetical protein
MTDFELISQLYKGLQAIANEQFPKKCANCGHSYESLEDFIKESKSMSGHDGNSHSGLKESVDDEGQPIVELFRNCRCGSTLLEFLKERRDTSPAGQKRRKKFGELLELLTEVGMEVNAARRELNKMLSGKESKILREIISKMETRDK